jgi:hypothetical protein
LTRAWREASDDDPPAALDEAIRAAARRAVQARPRAFAGSPFGGRWRVPLSVAAVLVVSATVTLLVAERERRDPGSLADRSAAPTVRAPDVYAEKPAGGPSPAPARTRAEPSMPAPSPGGAPHERESTPTAQPSTEERKIRTPAASPSSADKLQARTQGTDAPVQPMAAKEAVPEAGVRADQRAEMDEPPAAGVSPAAAPPAPPKENVAPAEEAVELAKREAQGAAKPKQRAAMQAPAPMQAQPALRDAAAPPSSPQAFPAAPPSKASPETAAAAGGDNLEPKAWLDRILELRRRGKLEEADKSLKAFCERYPAYPLPPELQPPR